MTEPANIQQSVIRLRFGRHRRAKLALLLFAAVILFVTVGPWLWPVDPTYPDLLARNSGFTLAHPLGADHLGRDMLARLMTGGRISIGVGMVSMAVAIGLGGFIGLLSGFFRAFDAPLMRLTELFLALPLLPLLLLMIALFREPLSHSIGSKAGMFVMIVAAIGTTSWMEPARILRGEVLSIKQHEFILAARAMGTPPMQIVRRHILPNVMSPVLVAASFAMANAMIAESALSFLGLGFPPDFPTWGRLLFDGTGQMTLYPSRVILPGVFISLTVLCVNYLGDGLRDALDPKGRVL